MAYEEFNHGEFRNLQQIGKGAFGTVYKATKGYYDEEVAIKIVRSSKAANDEIYRLKRLDHPNVVQLLGMSRSDGYDSDDVDVDDPDLLYHVPWIVMEFVDGKNLLDCLTEPGTHKGWGNLLVKMAHGIALGMEYIHSRGIVHRDLAARNVLVHGDWEVKIADFGISDEYEYGEHYQEVSGKPLPLRWMPPENIKGGHFSRKGDVWSFGVVLFEMWTKGSLPYAHLTMQQIYDNIQLGKNPLNYRKVLARSWILDLMRSCFQFDKSDRPNFRSIVETFEQEL